MHDNRTYRLYSTSDLVALKSDPNRWIVPDMIPRIGRTLVYGKGSVYKSTFFFDTAIAVASGGKLLENMPVLKVFGPVILLSCEGSIYTNRDRLMAHMRSRNVLPEAVQLYYGQQPLELRRDDGAMVLQRMVEQIRPAMVVIDPLVSFYGGNENDSEQMTAFTHRLDDLIAKYEFSLVIIHHANKTSDLRGSSVLQAWTDALIRLELNRAQNIPGFTEKMDIVTAHAEKQRDGRCGMLFSAVPFFDAELEMTTFGIYDTEDAAGVILTHLRNEILKLLRRTHAVMSVKEIGMAFTVGVGRIHKALAWLQENKLVDKVPAGQLGRTFDGWRVSPLGTRVDATRAILQAIASHGPTDADIAELG
jgi:hypothetical protein